MLAPLSIALEDRVKFGFNSGYAVMFFYIVSGFLITYTLTLNYDHNARGAVLFYRNRLIRIFSLYWPVLLLTFALIDRSWDKFLAADLADKLTGIFLLGMDWRLAFASYPDLHFGATIHGLEQAWTLGAELTFYLIAPLLIRSFKIGLALFLVSFGLRAAFVWALGPAVHDIWTYHFAVTTFGFFMMGHLICLAGRRWRPLSTPTIGVAFLVLSFTIMMFGGSYANFDTPRFWGAAVSFVIALPSLFELTKNIRWMNVAGDLSYPIYLVHTSVVSLLGPALISVALPLSLLPAAEAGYVSTAAYLVPTVLAAALVHKVMEVPIARLMRRATNIAVPA
jgi:peptidoglycan/LPS O-acetylase OafA/YrhL